MEQTFRFIICSMFDGDIKGSDNEEKCKELAEIDEFFIFDTLNNVWLLPEGGQVKIKEHIFKD